MAIDFSHLLWPALLHGAHVALNTLLVVMAAHPWPFVVAGVVAIVGAILPRGSRR